MQEAFNKLVDKLTEEEKENLEKTLFTTTACYEEYKGVRYISVEKGVGGTLNDLMIWYKAVPNSDYWSHVYRRLCGR